jgi:hypothetical protein
LLQRPSKVKELPRADTAHERDATPSHSARQTHLRTELRGSRKSGHGRQMWFAVGIALAIFATAMAPPTASSQSASRTLTGPALAGEWALEQQTREQWMHGREHPRFTPFRLDRHWVIVDSIRDEAASRRLYLTLGRYASGRDSARIVVGPTGHVVSLDVGLAPFTRRGPVFPGDSARWVDRQRRGGNDGVALQASRLWDVVPTVPPGVLRVGVTWTDTIARQADDGPFHQAMHGTRISQVIGKQIVGGRHLWIVHDSALVAYDERYPERERTLDTIVLVTRVTSGTIHGVHLYDPALRLSPERADTTRLSGDATLQYPDGRSYRTPARFERTRRWTLMDSTGYAARMAELRRGNARAYGGMVLVPTNAMEKRLAAGDVTARDSLLSAWRHATDPDTVKALFDMLYQWGTRDAASRARLDSVRVAAGDTAYLYRILAQRIGRREPVDIADVRAMLPFMEDPSLAWSYNVSRDWLYENLVQTLTTWPRAAAAVRPPRGSVACTIAACQLLAAQWRTAHEPRLRDVGLVALLSTEPARWADTVLKFAGPGHSLLSGAVPLILGVGATWPAASKAPLPSPTSDWHPWLEWMDGRDPRYLSLSAQSGLSAAFRGDTLPQVRFEESHATAVRFFEARTGRDVVAEWRHAYEETSSDSGRLVFGSMLEELGALQLTASQVAERFQSGDAARVALARRALFANAVWSPMDSAAAEPLVQRLLAITVDSAPVWRTGAADLRTPSRGSPTILHAARRQFFLNPEGLSSSVRAAWGARVQLMTPKTWGDRDEREAGVFYTISPLRSWGRFVRVELHASERTARTSDQVPSVNASSTTYYLMSLDGEWFIVSMDRWVT